MVCQLSIYLYAKKKPIFICERDRRDSPKIHAYRSDLLSKLATVLKKNVEDTNNSDFQDETEVLLKCATTLENVYVSKASKTSMF